VARRLPQATQSFSLVPVAAGHLCDQQLDLAAKRFSLHPDDSADQALGQVPALVAGEDAFGEPEIDERHLPNHVAADGEVGAVELAEDSADLAVEVVYLAAEVVEALVLAVEARPVGLGRMRASALTCAPRFHARVRRLSTAPAKR
jgi:hypothetical protein